MPGCGKRGKPTTGFPLFPRAPWKSRQQQARFPHFHSSGHEGGWKSGKPKTGFPLSHRLGFSLSRTKKQPRAGSALARGGTTAPLQWSPFPPPWWSLVIPPLTLLHHQRQGVVADLGSPDIHCVWHVSIPPRVIGECGNAGANRAAKNLRVVELVVPAISAGNEDPAHGVATSMPEAPFA